MVDFRLSRKDIAEKERKEKEAKPSGSRKSDGTCGQNGRIAGKARAPATPKPAASPAPANPAANPAAPVAAARSRGKTPAAAAPKAASAPAKPAAAAANLLPPHPPNRLSPRSRSSSRLRKKFRNHEGHNLRSLHASEHAELRLCMPA